MSPRAQRPDEIPARERQTRWRECCQSTDEHRFDCREAPKEQRGAGPVGPLRPATIP